MVGGYVMNAVIYEPSSLIGPEDIELGDYVTVSHETFEYIPTGCEHDGQLRRVTMLADNAGKPLKVVSLCPPFILVEDPNGKHYPVDLRNHRLARLSGSYGKEAFELMARNDKEDKATSDAQTEADPAAADK